MAAIARCRFDEQHEELLAHDALEFRERHAASGLLAHAPQEIETTFVEGAVGLAEVEHCADRRFARAAIRYALSQLFDAAVYEREMCGVLARPARSIITSL